MKGVLILLVTAIVVCVGNRTQGVHRHRHGMTGHKPERDTGSITLKPGTAMSKLFSGYGTNFRYIGEVKNGLDRVTVVMSDADECRDGFANCRVDSLIVILDV